MKKRKLKVDLVSGQFQVSNYALDKVVWSLAVLGALVLGVKILSGDLALVLIIGHRTG